MIDITIRLHGEELLVGGKLTHETVMLALEKSMAVLPSNCQINVNLSGVSRCDSASLAFLTALIREGKKKNTQFQFSHMPGQMLQISWVSGLDDVLPIVQR